MQIKGMRLRRLLTILRHTPCMARKPPEPAPESAETEVEETLVPSELDELTHAEMLMLYHEATKSSRLGKVQQCRSLAIGVAAIFALGVFGGHVEKDGFLFRLAEFLAVLVSLAAIYLIVFYQYWQNTERDKLLRIAARLSSFTRAIRGISSAREASLRRFVILGFMILVILTAAALAILYLNQLPG
jgi:hypothetical protein